MLYGQLPAIAFSQASFLHCYLMNMDKEEHSTYATAIDANQNPHRHKTGQEDIDRLKKEVTNFQEKLKQLRQANDVDRTYLINAYQRCIHIRLKLIEVAEPTT